MRGAVVDVAGDPHDVADVALANEAKNLCDFELTSERRTVLSVRDRLEVRLPITDDQSIGMSLAMTFHVARLASSRAFNQSTCAAPMMRLASVNCGCRFSLFAPR